MNQRIRDRLKEKLEERVTFDSQLLDVYDHDIGEIPSIIMSMINCKPEAAVVVQSNQDVIDTLSIASEFGIAVTPRGQGSSGYGGAIPTNGGIVLDMACMNKIISINKEQHTVDVEPGIIWNNLSFELRKIGLDNSICPTSAPSSTVGGWFPKGGVGLGSMRYGSVRDVVTEIDVIDLDCKVRTYSGSDMEIYHQTCGIFGVIVRLRLKCIKAERIVPYGVLLPNTESVQSFIIKARERLNPYTIILHSSGYIRMRKQENYDNGNGNQDFHALIAFEESNKDDITLKSIINESGGESLSKETAMEEWEDRFYPMRIKKFGPSVLVGEFYLPEKCFDSAWTEIEKDLANDTLGMEAVVVNDNKMAVLVYILDNAKSMFYQIRMAKALRPLGIALRYGGSFYTAGLWLANNSKELFGMQKYNYIVNTKKERDSKLLLNPGKIIPPKIRQIPLLNICVFMNLISKLMSPIAKISIYKNRYKSVLNEKHGE